MYFKCNEKHLFKRWLFIKRDVFVVSLGDFLNILLQILYEKNTVKF